MVESTVMAAFRLRKHLHTIPEKSGEEVRTRESLMNFLRSVEGLEVVDCGKWFYAAHREPGAEESLTIRADLDAVTGADGFPYHGCGHDGHMSVAAALAEYTAGKSFGKNVFFLFQHAEETGEGAKECLRFFDMEKTDAIYGFHNCPGFPEGAVLLLPECFACASMGLILEFSGVQTHAAYPENGNNPIFPMTEFFSRWEELTDSSNYKGMVLATPVCFSAGSRSFGVAAGSGEICLTIRAGLDEDLKKLKDAVINFASKLGEKAGVGFSFSEMDVFPATPNSSCLLDTIVPAAHKAGLECIYPSEAFRWSEDFGRYHSKADSFMIGIGAGETAAGLHTPEYSWNDAVTRTAVSLFENILNSR